MSRCARCVRVCVCFVFGALWVLSSGVPALGAAPVAKDDSAVTYENTPVVIDVLRNDIDPDGGGLSIDAYTQPLHGKVTCSLVDCTYTPNTGFLGADGFNYTISSAHSGLTSSAVVGIQVLILNYPPTAVADSITTNEDTAITYNILLNDTDPEGSALNIIQYTQPSHGAVLCATPNCTYTPGANYNGSDSFSYTISDGHGGQASAQVTITVLAVNDRPIANNDSGTTNEDQSITLQVLANDTDVENDPLSIASFTQGAHGAVTCSSPSCTYTPSLNYNGADSFTYTVSDGHGGQGTGLVSITINPVNDPPQAQSQTLGTIEDTPLGITLSCTDVDSATLSYLLVANPVHGSLSGTPPSLTYTPEHLYNGSDSFTFKCNDGSLDSNIASLSITTSAVNNPPVAKDDSATTDEGKAVTVQVLANDSDPDNDAIKIVDSTQPAHGVSSCRNPIAGSAVSIEQVAICQYTPVQYYNGTDSFTYTIADPSGAKSTAKVSITINAVNDPPIAKDDAVTISENQAVTVDVLANDSDPDGTSPVLASYTQPAHGAVTCGTTCTYTPVNYYSGQDSFSYTVKDEINQTGTANVIITIQFVNHPPVASNDSVTTNEDQPVTIDVLANDSDPDGTNPTIASFTQASHGSVTCTSTCTYTPTLYYNGQDSFSYTIKDDANATSTADVVIAIQFVNHPPVARDDIASDGIYQTSINEDESVTIDVLANDYDPDGTTPVIDSFTQPAHGSSACGSNCTYTPNHNFNGYDSFNYTIRDSVGATSTATVSITVNPVNDPPVAVNDNITTSEDQAVNIDVLANDSDPDGTNPTIASFTQASHGAVTCASTCIYTPTLYFYGQDSFSYTIKDDANAASTATVSITIGAVNHPPVAKSDSVTTNEDQSVTLDVLANDSDPDGTNPTIASFTLPAHGSLTCSATCTYTPSLNYNGSDSFNYTIKDAANATSSASVSITVISVNDPPVAKANGPYACATGQSITLSSSGSSDVDGIIVSYVWSSGATGQAPAYACQTAGTITITLTVTDNEGASGSASTTITTTDPSTGWDRSSMQFSGLSGVSCSSPKSVYATIMNGGDRAMNGSTGWELWYISTGNPKSGVMVGAGNVPALSSGGSYTISLSVTADGYYMFKAYQRPGHPGTGVLWSDSIHFEAKKC
ncbi:tandem-95 repeat protein [Candidatus Acetothermia bacterium]|nr:tandem-95 repeat protein [Candidatus Acetothermia bacterium]MBI3643003.1 tandem-95 repeat protein [Candidatus Acetothermia bacterium]